MHKIQKIILKRLLVKNRQKYSVLTQGYSFEDNIVFHLKQLTNQKYIEKQGTEYQITTSGVKVVTKFDLDSLEDTGFKTLFLGFVCKCGDEYLLKEHSNNNQSFYNLHSGKPNFGENIEDSLIRTFKENTNLKLSSKDFKYISLHLKTVKTPTAEILFDDAFTVYEVDITEEQKAEMKLQKNIKWFSLEEIKKLSNCWPEVDILLIKKDYTNYLSYEFETNYIL